MFRPDNIQWPKQVWEKTNIVQHLGNENLYVCIPLLSKTDLQNIFHSNQHTCKYLSESNAHDVLWTCRTRELFNTVDECKPLLQCIKSDTLYMDIQWHPWQVIQVIKPSPDDGHIPQNNLFTDIMSNSHSHSKIKTTSSTLLCVNCSCHCLRYRTQ